jgi:hypothetical protein
MELFDSTDLPRHDFVTAIKLIETTKVYRQLAKEFHPDRNAGGATAMRAVNQMMDAIRSDVGRAEGRASTIAIRCSRACVQLLNRNLSAKQRGCS